ncbi:7070_t:CDS:2 [Cetraspora pellucida]|uniref:7070_t:CDS:1 n=1 Tax=Cetraspora pellucida TaxID=1433469 RepID=A0ACA9N8Q8_9GLOM|nr:7070_t:CDS:2 [Cetraspora pellucida]
MTKNRDDWKRNAEECKKHKKEIEIKIDDIISSHLSINLTEIKNLTTIRKLDTILNTIKQEIKECLKLLEILFQTGDSLIKFIEMFKNVKPKTKINDPKSFNENDSSSIDALVKACYKNSKIILNGEPFFVKRPELSFVRKLMRWHYYIVGKSNLLSVKTMAKNLFKINDPESEKM